MSAALLWVEQKDIQSVSVDLSERVVVSFTFCHGRKPCSHWVYILTGFIELDAISVSSIPHIK